MAEVVQRQLELMVPELKLLIKVQLFSKDEVKQIVKKRTKFEYSLKRRVALKADYLRSIEYEMNLEALRIKRKGSGGSSVAQAQKKTSQVFVKRITSLFERALLRFKGDVKIWLQYMAFVKKQNNKPFLGVLMARAIQAFPLNTGFWIMAASWELENRNMTSARVLMQRGLRLNNHREDLWLEYFRLELYFLAQMRAKRSSQGGQGLGDDSDDDDDDVDSSGKKKAAEKLISVPTLAGENADEAELRKKSAVEETGSFYDGAIPRLIFRNAIQAIPTSLPLRTKFLAIARSFALTQALRDFIYASIQKDFATDPEGVAALCTRAYDEILDKSDVDTLQPGINKSCVAFEEVLATQGSARLWNHYISFIQNCTATYGPLFEKAGGKFLSEKMFAVYKVASGTPFVTEEMFITWINTALKHASTELSTEIVLEVASLATQRFPASQALWLAKINVSAPSFSRKELEKLYVQAIKVLPERSSFEVWHSYLTWLTSHPELHDQEYLKAKFEQAIGNTGQGTESLLVLYLSWTYSSFGLIEFRELASRIINLPGATENVLLECLNIENKEAKPSLQKRRIFFEALVTRFKTQERLWLMYLKMENDAKEFDRVNNIHWRAMKAVANPESFVIQYNQMK